MFYILAVSDDCRSLRRVSLIVALLRDHDRTQKSSNQSESARDLLRMSDFGQNSAVFYHILTYTAYAPPHIHQHMENWKRPPQEMRDLTHPLRPWPPAGFGQPFGN